MERYWQGLKSLHRIPQQSDQACRGGPQGRYTCSLSPGLYVLKRRVMIFSLSQEKFAWRGGNLSIDFQLTLRPVSESVTVEAETELEKVPGGVALVPQKEIAQSRASNLKDVLNFTPGVLAQSRYGADESQLSIRGSGLRSNFHSRGVNLLINGLPYQDADGFSDTSRRLLATQRVEVWKALMPCASAQTAWAARSTSRLLHWRNGFPLQINVMGGATDFSKANLDCDVKVTSIIISVLGYGANGFREHSRRDASASTVISVESGPEY